MPNRIIRESMLDSDRYHDLVHDAERLLFIELLLLADDFGLVPLNHAFLRRRTSPCAAKTVDQITTMVSALADRDLVRVYRSERGGVFGFIPRFGNAPRAIKPKWPAPPDIPAFNDFKVLAEKRIADAQHLPTNAPETETVTDSLKPKSLVDAADAATDVAVAVIEKAKTTTALPPCPYEEIVEAYHETLPTLSRVVVLTGQRKANVGARWRQVWQDSNCNQAQGVDLFRGFFKRVAKSKFLTGQTTSSDGRKWRADFAWLVKEENFAKVLEGRYE